MIVDTLSLVILLLRCRQSVVFHTERNQHSRHSLLEETVVINGESCNYYQGTSRERNERKCPGRTGSSQATGTSCKRVIVLFVLFAVQVNVHPHDRTVLSTVLFS